MKYIRILYFLCCFSIPLSGCSFVYPHSVNPENSALIQITEVPSDAAIISPAEPDSFLPSGSDTATPSVFSTDSVSNSASDSASASDTPTPVASPTKEPAQTYTPSPRPATSTPTIQPADTATPSLEPANTSTPTATPTPTLSPTKQPFVSSTPKPTAAPTPTIFSGYVERVTFYVPQNLTIPVGNTANRYYAVNSANAVYLQGSYTVSDTSVATVSYNGTITTKKPGKTDITLTVAGRTKTISITVTNTSAYAYISGDKTGLSAVQTQIYAVVVDVLDTVITDDMSDYEKVKAIHDYIILNTEYDMAYYDDGNVADSSFTSEGVLLYHVAVCQGYAETFHLFMTCLGINDYVATGTASGILHAWNIVELDGEWYNVDTTFDDPVPDVDGYVSYQYFLVPDSSLDGTHTVDAGFPACTATYYTYYMYQGHMISSISLYEDKFAELYQQGLSEITILYPEYDTPDFVTIISKYHQGKIGYYPIYTRGDYTVFTVVLMN